MARLPIPGSDSGQWGTILNDFLSQAHDSAGALAANSVGSSQIQADSVTGAKIPTNAVGTTHIQTNAVTSTKIPSNAITSTHIADAALPQAKVANLTTDLAAKVDTTDVRLTDQVGYYPPQGYGFFATSEVITLGTSSSTTGTGSLALCRIWVPAGKAINTISALVQSAGTLSGGGVNGFGLYSDAGTLVTQTVSDNNLWTSTGWRTASFSSAVAAQSTGRFIYVGVLVNGYSSAPDLRWHNCGSDLLVGAGVGVTNRRSFYDAGHTTFPASFNPASFGTLNSYIPILGLA